MVVILLIMGAMIGYGLSFIGVVLNPPTEVGGELEAEGESDLWAIEGFKGDF